MHAKTKAPPAPLPDARAKQVLKEAVDAVVNSFAKHTQGYGRGTSAARLSFNYSHSLPHRWVTPDSLWLVSANIPHLNNHIG